MLFPLLSIWTFIADNEGQYESIIDGRMFGLTGNPTHSGYLTLLITISLIGLRINYLYILLSIISLVLILNKMSILVFIVFGGVLIFSQAKSTIKKIALSFISLTFRVYTLIFVIYPFIERWSEVGYDTHTITYRTYIYTQIYQAFNIQNNYILFGLPELYKKISLDAFDSLPALFITKYGIVITILIYLLIFTLSTRNLKSLLFYFILIIPSLTMVSFYNTTYIMSIFLLYFQIVKVLQRPSVNW